MLACGRRMRARFEGGVPKRGKEGEDGSLMLAILIGLLAIQRLVRKRGHLGSRCGNFVGGA